MHMRVASIGGRLVLRRGEGFVDVAGASGGVFGPDPQQAFADWERFAAWGRELLAGVPVPEHAVSPAGARWDAPVPRPAQVFAIGLNYRDHVAEAGLRVPETPAVFTKFATSITGHGRPVALPEGGSTDWEAELVVVIGRRAQHVAREQAWAHVAGLTVGQDLSERTLQLAGPAPQFSLGKSYPGFAPLGPELVTVDEFDDPDDLELGCRLEGGEVLQKSRTSNLVFDVPELVARLSAVCPLLPGDVIFTGTPSGVGMARTPQRFLAPGDVLETWIEGVGSLRTPLVAP
jgi:2-keto-4-pentenoate hydratase/2-oxohepta-3-ene-1,7-dioic acid hydratase in catechol pathway